MLPVLPDLNQTNTVRISGSLTRQMFNSKVYLVFDTLQAEALQSLLQLRSAIDQPAAHYQHGVSGKEEIGESEMNNLKRYRQAHVTKLTFYSSSDL